jgi:4-hydroxybenzoate polyprenyltransferase
MDDFETTIFPFLLRELRKFVRIETCLVVSCITLSGYMLFNTYSPELLFLMLAVFFGCGASYGYNQLTDKKEDAVNNKRLNMFVTSKWGNYVIMGCTSIGFLSALALPLISLMIYLICMFAGFAYSFFRIKRFFLMKNIYSGTFIAAPFLIGSTTGNEFAIGMIPYFLLILLVGFTSNLIGDVRGYRGDMLAELRTMPTVIGIRTSKGLIHFNLIMFSFVVLALGYVTMIPMIPFLGAVLFFLNRDNHIMVRSSMASTFFVMILAVFLLEVMGV